MKREGGPAVSARSRAYRDAGQAFPFGGEAGGDGNSREYGRGHRGRIGADGSDQEGTGLQNTHRRTLEYAPSTHAIRSGLRGGRTEPAG